MAAVAVKPIVLKDILFQVDADDYAAAVSQAQFDPASNTVTWQGGKPDATFTDTTPATWTLALTFAQDWESATSLSRYLFDHEGETIDVTLKPKASAAPSFTAKVIIVPGSIGGQIGAYSTATVTLGVQGKPALAAA